MNKVFKVIWCKSSQTWIAVSELAKAFSLSSTRTHVKKRIIKALLGTFPAASLLSLSMSTQAYIEIGSTEHGFLNTIGADAAPGSGSDGVQPLNYFNPGNKSYDDKDQSNNNVQLYTNSNGTGIAIGNHSQGRDAKNNSNGIAIGDYAKGSGGLGTAIGFFAQTEKNSGIAIGANARSAGANALAMMRQSAATGDYSTAIGSVSWSKGEASFALGASATAKGNQSIAIGSVKPTTYTYNNSAGQNITATKYNGLDNTQTNGDRSMALGSSAKTNGDDSFAIGYESQTGKFNTTFDSYLNSNVTEADTSEKADKAIAIGTKAKALKESAVTIGYESLVNGTNAVAVGKGAQASYDNVVAIGAEAHATADKALAVGYEANATAKNASAFGNATNASADGASAFGSGANASGASSVAFGIESIASDVRSVAVGKGAQASKQDDIAVGSGAKTNSKNLTMTDGQNGTASLAFGARATADGYNAVSIGTGSVAEQSSAIAVGGKASGIGAVTLGYTTNASGNSTVAIGYYANASKSSATAIGTQATASGNTSTAIGAQAKASGISSTAIGAGANATFNRSVAIGSSSQTDSGATKESTATVNGLTYSGFAGNTPEEGHVVSVGNATVKRQIKNVAAGNISSSSTDAINGSQLYAVTDTLGNLANSTKALLGGSSALAPNGTLSGFSFQVMGPDNSTGTGGIGNASNVHDALTNLNTYVNKGWDIAGNDKIKVKSIQPTEKVSFLNGVMTNVTVAGDGENATVMYDVKTANITSNSTTGVASGTENGLTTAKTVSDAINTAVAKSKWVLAIDKENGGESTTDAESNITPDTKVVFKAGKNLKIVKSGTNVTYSTQDNVNFTTVTATEKISIANGPELTKTGINANNKKITNLEDGEISANSKEAVNGSQLHKTNQNVTNLTNKVDEGLNFKGDNTNVTVNHKLGSTMNVTGGQADNSKLSDNNIGVIGDANGSMAIKLAKELKGLTNAEFKDNNNTTTLNGSGVVIAPSTNDSSKTVSLTNSGLNNGGNKITNVANGTEDGDAVNFSQLKNVIAGAVSTESVVKKDAATGDVNLAEITVADNKAVGSANAKYEVSVSKKAVQNAAKEAVNMKGSAPINVNKTDVNGVDTYDVTFNGTEAAKSIPLTYKANGSGDKTVMLDNGLNFTNGTMTTASVADNGVVKYDVNLSTIKVEDGKAAVAGTPGTNGANGTDGKDGVATVKNVVDALNNAAWTITSSKSDGEVVGNTSNSVKNGDTVTYDAGKNIKITQDNKKFSFATKDDVEFTSVTTGNTKLTTNGVEITNGPKLTQSGIDAGSKKVTNVANGTISADSKDAVNGGQLFAETAKAKTTVEKDDDNIKITSENATDGHINYKVALNPSLTVGPKTGGNQITIDGNQGHITGLTNKSWNGTPTSGRAATEDQLSVVDKKFDNKVSLGGDNGSTTEKALSHTGGIKFNIKGGDNQKYVTTSASGDDVTVDLAQTTKDKIDNAANKDLSNITNNGKKVITDLGAIVTADDSTITVTNETDNTTGQKTYKIKANLPKQEKTVMASGKNTTLEGDGSTANPFKVNLKDDLVLGQKDAVGANGKDASIKVNGKDGSAVAINGKDGSIALNGKDGSNPVTIKTAQGSAGVNGVNPKDRLMVNNETVATLEDGLKFAGDNGTETINKTLNQKLEIVGGADKNKLSDNNIGVNANNGKLEVKLAKTLNDLTSAQFKDGDNTTLINGSGMTITPKDPTKAVSLTDKGLSNGGNQIVNIDSGLKQADGSTVALKDATGKTLKNAASIGDLQKSINDITDANQNGGFGLSDDNGATAKANLGETVKVKGDGSVITKVVTDNGKPTLQVGLSNHITLGDDTQAGTVTVKGENGKDGISINGKDASVTFAKDGQTGMSIAATRGADGKDALTLKGKDGKDSISFQEDGRITQVADGINDKDAVNKSQLDRSIAQVKSGVSAGKNMTVTPHKNADGSTTYTVETQDDVEFTTVKTGDAALDNNGLRISGGPSMTKDGIHANDKKITGVKDGEISANSKEAVNGSQLHQTNQNVTNLANNVDKGLNFQGDNQEVTVNRKLGDQLNIRGGADPKKLTQNNIGVRADKNGTMTVQLAKEVNLGADGSLTVGNTTVNNDGVAIKGGPSMTNQGINAGGKQITNVARGKAPTDAVNMSQLQEVGNAINNHLENIDNRVNKMDKRRKAGTASALATAGLMQPHRDGQSALVAAVGQYQSETAVAVGYSRISDNGKYGVKVSFSTNSQGEVGGTAGAGYFW